MSDTPTTGQFLLHSVELVECVFKKHEVSGDLVAVSAESLPVNTVEITTSYKHEGPYLWVFVTAKVNTKHQGRELLKAEVTMKGLFEQKGETQLNVDTFAQVNGPAILFPFIREQLASLTMKANIPPILLAPINFVKRAGEAPVQ
ncbi:MAG: protein-export chaperone SecB [Flavobacteriales bacterium]